MTWSRRYVLKSYIRASVWVVPFFAVLLYWVVARIAQGIGDWLMRTGRIDEATSLYALNISFLVFTFGSLLVAIQVAGGQYTPRIIATTLLRDNAKNKTEVSGAILLAALAFVCHACASPALAPPAVKTAKVASPRALPPTIEELKNATYAGLGEHLGPVTLANGRWTGAPSALGAASRPSVELADDFRVVGDLDGDGFEEAVVALTYSSGGTGVLSFLAVVTRQAGTLRNVATTALGDRVQIRSARVEGGRLLVSAVRAGENDAACCPGDLVEWQWGLGHGRLNMLGAVTTGRLSLATLAGTVWILRAWDITVPAELEPVVTLSYDAGRFTGTGGCNRYFAVVEGGAMPGEVKVGPLAGTRMACPEPQSSVEARFLEQLGGARTFGFMLGRLAISYTRGDGSRGTMLFGASTAPKGP